MTCFTCGSEDHETTACPHFTQHDRQMMSFGAALFVNTQMEGDYGQNLLLDFESALETLCGEEDDGTGTA